MKLIDGWEIEKLSVSIPSKKAIDGVARKIAFDPIPQSVQDELDKFTGDVVDILATVVGS